MNAAGSPDRGANSQSYGVGDENQILYERGNATTQRFANSLCPIWEGQSDGSMRISVASAVTLCE